MLKQWKIILLNSTSDYAIMAAVILTPEQIAYFQAYSNAMNEQRKGPIN